MHGIVGFIFLAYTWTSLFSIPAMSKRIVRVLHEILIVYCKLTTQYTHVAYHIKINMSWNYIMATISSKTKHLFSDNFSKMVKMYHAGHIAICILKHVFSILKHVFSGNFWKRVKIYYAGHIAICILAVQVTYFGMPTMFLGDSDIFVYFFKWHKKLKKVNKNVIVAVCCPQSPKMAKNYYRPRIAYCIVTILWMYILLTTKYTLVLVAYSILLQVKCVILYILC